MRRTTNIATPVAHLVGPGKLKVINGKLAFTTGKNSPMRLDPNKIRFVWCYGPVGVTDEAFQVLFAQEVDVAWLTSGGTRCCGRLGRSDPTSTPLRLCQHQVLGNANRRLELARWCISAKVNSQILAVRHYQRHGYRNAGAALGRLQKVRGQVAEATRVDALRGLEGIATSVWFDVFGSQLQAPWEFPGRMRRPPPDPINALLSLGYTLVHTRTVARCEAMGLEVYLGALHEYRPGRPSLACDLMEPLRVPAVDRWVLAVCNEGKLSPEAFERTDQGVRLRQGWFGPTIRTWEEHWLWGGHEKTLDGLLLSLVANLRHRSPLAEAIDLSAGE